MLPRCLTLRSELKSQVTVEHLERHGALDLGVRRIRTLRFFALDSITALEPVRNTTTFILSHVMGNKEMFEVLRLRIQDSVTCLALEMEAAGKLTQSLSDTKVKSSMTLAVKAYTGLYIGSTDMKLICHIHIVLLRQLHLRV